MIIKKYIIYCEVSYIIYSDSINLPILTENTKTLINKVTNNIDNIYNQIKKNELSPNTDYLFNNVNANNIEKTISKLKMIQSITIPNIENDNDQIL